MQPPRFLRLALCSVSVTLVGAAPLPAPGEEPDVDALVSLMAARDDSILPLRASYRVAEVPGRASELDHFPGEHEVLRGWMWWDGRDVLAGQSKDVPGLHSLEYTIEWSALESRTLIERRGPANPDYLPATRIVEETPVHYLGRARPFDFGFGHFYATWPDVFSSSCDLRALGRESVRGVDCLKLRFRYGGTAADDHGYPMDVWIDDRESLLVRKVMCYLTLEDARRCHQYTPEDLAGVEEKEGDERIVPQMLWEVLEVRALGDCHVPVLGRMVPQGSGLVDEAVWVELEMDADGVRAARPELSFELPAGGAHFDRIRGETYVSDGAGGELENDVTRYRRALARFGVEPESLPWEELDFSGASCGASAALMVAHLSGGDCGFEELARSDPGALERRELDFGHLTAFLHGQGLETLAAESTTAALARWSGPTICQTREPLAAGSSPVLDSAHFVVARWTETDDGPRVQCVEPPGSPKLLEPDDFAENWTGKVLFVSADAGAFEAFDSSAGSALPRRLALALAVAALTWAALHAATRRWGGSGA